MCCQGTFTLFPRLVIVVGAAHTQLKSGRKKT